MSEVALYRRIANDFIDKIEKGELRGGDRIPTEAELERSYKVSRITVSRAIHELQTRQLVYRVKGSGTFVSKKDLAGISLGRPSAQGMSIISVVFAQGQLNGAHDMLMGIEGECAKDGVYVTFHNSHARPGVEHGTIQKLLRQGCGGLLVLPCYAGGQNLDLYSEMRIKGIPMVFVDRRIDYVDLPLVACDNQGAVRDLTARLIEDGHRRIGFYCNSPEVASSEQERYRGYCEAHIAAGLPLDSRLVFRRYTSLDIPEELFEVAAMTKRHIADEALDHYWGLDNRPTCVVAVNDILAVALLRAALARGIKVPEELSVTGFDDLEVAQHLNVPLTTVRQPFEQIGVVAARRLLNIVEGRVSVTGDIRVPAEIVYRASTAPSKVSCGGSPRAGSAKLRSPTPSPSAN